MLASNVPEILAQSLKSVNMKHLDFTQNQLSKIKTEKNEFKLFINNNESGVTNIVVYLFWIVMSVLFNEVDALSFSQAFIEEVRQALTD